MMDMIFAYGVVAFIFALAVFYRWIEQERPLTNYRLWVWLVFGSMLWPLVALMFAIHSWVERDRSKPARPLWFR